MDRDEVVVALLVVAFAALVTAHASIVAGLLRRRPRKRAFIAAVVPPLAPYWAVRQGMLVRAGAWGLSLALYFIARLVAIR